MILVGASCLGLSFCGSLSSSPNAFSISESHTDINVNLVNGVAIRILNSAATAEITELDLSTTAAPTGTFVTDNFKVEVSTANKTGYKLYMNSSYQNPSTSTYTTDLVNQTNTSYTIPTVAAAVSKTDLSTAAPGTTNANKWAYSLDDATYSPVPANSVQTQIGSHDTPTAGTKTPVYIGMNVNVEKPSGAYKNQLTFSAVGNPIPTDYTLYFEPGGTGVSGLPETMTASEVSASHAFTIPSPAPTRSGYNFTGYSDGASTYQPGDTITVNGDIDYTGTATLTAQWDQLYTVTISNTKTTSSAASVTMPKNGSATVNVTPNAGFYLASATCPQGYTCSVNSGTSVTTQQTLTITNNNTASGGTANVKGVTRFWAISTMQEMTTDICNSLYTPSNVTGSSVNPITNATAYEVVTGDNQPYVAQHTLRDVRDNNNYTVKKLADGNCWMTSNLKYSLSANSTRVGVNHSTNQTFEFNTGSACSGNENCIMNGNTVMTEHYDGYYYSWYAATAGTGTSSMTSSDATGSICPQGWRLPANYTSSTAKSYGALTQTYLGFSGNTHGNFTVTMGGSPLGFALPGIYMNGSFSRGGTHSYYWSSTANATTTSYEMCLNVEDTYPQCGTHPKYEGGSVRCVNI